VAMEASSVKFILLANKYVVNYVLWSVTLGSGWSIGYTFFSLFLSLKDYNCDLVLNFENLFYPVEFEKLFLLLF